MARKGFYGKIAWVGLVFCLLMGGGGSGVWAEDDLGIPLVVGPDSANPIEGTLTLKTAQGGLGGVFFVPTPGVKVVLAPSPGHHGIGPTALHLSGTAPNGRPLEVTLGSLRLMKKSRTVIDTSSRVKPDSQEKVQIENPLSGIYKLWRHWVWLALCSVGGIILLISVFLLWHLRKEAEVAEDEEEFDGAAPQSVLRLKAQVETLAREKAELEAAVKEKNRQAKQLQAEKEEMQAALERLQQKSQANSKALGDLEEKLQEAEQEALRVKQEYMALYARNQQEKEVLKKN